MNNRRRSKIKGIIEQLNIQQSKLSELYDAEQDSLDNFPENLESSDRHSDMEEAIDKMSDALDSLQSTIDTLEEIK